MPRRNRNVRSPAKPKRKQGGGNGVLSMEFVSQPIAGARKEPPATRR